MCAAGRHCGVYASVAGNTMWKCGGKLDFVRTELHLADHLIIRVRVTEHRHTHIRRTHKLSRLDIDDCLFKGKRLSESLRYQEAKMVDLLRVCGTK